MTQTSSGLFVPDIILVVEPFEYRSGNFNLFGKLDPYNVRVSETELRRILKAANLPVYGVSFEHGRDHGIRYNSDWMKTICPEAEFEGWFEGYPLEHGLPEDLKRYNAFLITGGVSCSLIRKDSHINPQAVEILRDLEKEGTTGIEVLGGCVPQIAAYLSTLDNGIRVAIDPVSSVGNCHGDNMLYEALGGLKLTRNPGSVEAICKGISRAGLERMLNSQ